MHISQLIALLAIPATLPSKAAASKSSCKPIKPPAEGCGVIGNVKPEYVDSYPYFGEPQITSSVEECARLCGRRRFDPSVQGQYAEGCVSFEFDKSNGLCQLGHLNITEHVDPSENAKTVFFDISCFDCGSFCNQPYGTELLDNTGFEEPLLGPWGALGLTLAKGHNSKRSVVCRGGHDCRLDQGVNICPTEMYSIQYDYKFKALASYAAFSFRNSFFQQFQPFYRSLYVEINDDPAEPGLWRTARTYFQPGLSTTTMTFNLSPFGRGGAVSIDNVKMSRIKSLTAKPGANSLLVNGGFESGKFAPWKFDQADDRLAIKSPGIHSSYGIGFKQISEFIDSAFLSQNVTTEPGKIYLFSFDSVIPNIPINIDLLLRSEREDILYSETLSNGSSTISFPFVTLTNQTNIAFSFSIRTDKVPKNQKTIFDNFRFVEAEVNT